MPLSDALSFVARNFDSYLRMLREPPRHARPPSPRDYGRSSYPSAAYSGSYEGYYARPPVSAPQAASYDRRGPEVESGAVGRPSGGYREDSGRQQVDSNLSSKEIGEMLSKLQGKKEVFQDILN